MGVRILSTGSFIGSETIENPALFRRVRNFDRDRAKETVRKKGNNVEGLGDEELFDLWVRQVCGVERRGFFSRGQVSDPDGPAPLTEHMGYLAGKNAIETAAIDPRSIEHVIFSSYTPEQLMPNPACMVAHYLGARGASAFHMNTACSSFLDGLGIAYLMIRSGEYSRILVISADLMSQNMDFGDVTTAILFGDGASAAVLDRSPGEDTGGILSYASMTDYNPEMLNMDTGKPIRMSGGPLVQRNAVNAMHASLKAALQKASLDFEDLSYLIPHQANLRILQRLADKVKVPYERTLQSVTFTGNVSGAAIGIGLDRAFKQKIDSIRFQKNDILGLTTVGGGYTFSGMIYRV